MVDHTLLSPTATQNQIKELCTDAVRFNCASVCVPPSFVTYAKQYAQNKIAVCTVIGFPLGYQTTKTKVFETMDALSNGATEIDMVINIAWLKEKRYNLIQEEIAQVKKVCGNKILKVIIETCYLTQDEKIEACKAVTNAGADFIKTSTGFGTAGATIEDIILFKNHIGKNVGIKASGGISTFEQAQDFIAHGATRLGTSKLVLLAKGETNEK